MRFIVFTLLFIGLVSSCTPKNQMPISLEGRTLMGTITSASGVFTGLEGYQFRTQFISENHFETKETNGTVESMGQYALQKNRLILKSTSGLHADEQLEVILKFTDTKSGVYEAHSLSGLPGEETGIFTLQ